MDNGQLPKLDLNIEMIISLDWEPKAEEIFLELSRNYFQDQDFKLPFAR